MLDYSLMKISRLKQKATLDDLSNLLGLSKQRLSQFENGEAVPIERLKEWARNETLPAWVRLMAYEMWTTAIPAELEQLAEKINPA